MTVNRNRGWPHRYVGSIEKTVEYYGSSAPEYIDFVSECCYRGPATELDMSSMKYGGPSGFCGKCLDNCIFIVQCHNCGDNAVLTRKDFDQYCQKCNDWIESLG